jgi:ABC-2 type transport system permease protein
MRSRIGAIALKEWLHVLRDWRTLLIAVVLPLLLLFIFGYGITFDIRDIRLVVRDQDRTPASRALVESVSSSRYFRVVGRAESERDVAAALSTNLAHLVLDIRPGYAADLAAGRTPAVQVLVDGAENTTGMLAAGYLGVVFQAEGTRVVQERLNRVGIGSVAGVPAVSLRTRFWYNEELTSPSFIIPGVIALVMMLLCTLLTSLALVRERERGSLEQLIATPVRASEIVLGKMVPYFGLGVFDTVLITVVGHEVFGVPLRGHVATLMLFTVLFAAVALGIGMAISSIATNQVFALQVSIISQMLPTLILSGFMFPIKEMPVVLQGITVILPARYVISALRGIFLKGSGLMDLWREALVLTAFAAVFLGLAAKRFRKRLE